MSKGFAATTMEEVRRRAKASIGSIYHHFDSKEELAAALYVEGLRDYQAGFLRELSRHESAEDAVGGVVRHHVRWIAANAVLARFLFQRRAPELRLASARTLRSANRSFFKEVLMWLEGQAERGEIRRLPREVYYALWIGPAQEFGRSWLAGDATTAVDQAAEILARAAWQSLRATEGE